MGSCAGTFYALDRASGAIRWRQSVIADSVRRQFHGDPLVTDDLVVVGTDAAEGDSGFVFAFDRSGGEVRWKRRAGRGVTTDVVRSGPRGYVVSLDDELLCLDLVGGAVVWRSGSGSQGEGIRRGSPIVVGDRVFFAASDWSVRAHESATGRPLWTRSLDAHLSTGLAAIGGQLACCADDGYLYALDPQTGTVAARVPITGGPYLGEMAASGDSLLVLLGERSLAGFDWAAKRTRWTRAAPQPWSSSRPALWRGEVVAGTQDGDLFAFRLGDGAPRWFHHVGGVIRGIGSAADALYVGTYAGRVHALKAER